jgi:4-deoxy-L-threo-5-hexosulose-uronate ketol-isomerase
MEVRYSTDPNGFRTMTQDELRKMFLIDSLFVADAIPMIYSDIDRSITGSAVPVKTSLKLLSSKQEMAAEYFTARREIGIINIGGGGVVIADRKRYRMSHKDALYVGRETKEVLFESNNPKHPAQFYFVSYPAHAKYPTILAKFSDAEPAKLGNQKQANKRTIYKYIHPKGIQSCQLVMGLTELDEGSVWNTMPPHTHQRRSEIYMYFGLSPDSLVFHMMGQPDETKHIVLRDRQAVFSPSWSIHAGVATQAYTFIWGMGGENQVFDDMDGVNLSGIK